MLGSMAVTQEQREELRKRFGLIPTLRTSFEITQEDIEKDGRKRGGGGEQQAYDARGRYTSGGGLGSIETIGRVGVRQPKGEDPAEARMELGAIVKQDARWAEKSLDLMRQVPGFEKAKNHDQVVERIARNITDVMETVTPDLERVAKSWYPLGHEFNRAEARANGLPDDVMHVVTARLSPQKDWFHNLAMARAFARTHAENPTLDYDTIDTANLLRVSAWEAKKNPNIPKPEIIDAGKYVGKRLSELPDDLAGELVRPLTILRGENHTINIDGTPVINNQGKTSAISWQSGDSMGRAMRMIRAQDRETAHEILGQQHKIRSFYENMRDPMNTSGFDDVTIDTHALGMGVGIPWGSSERMINTFFGSPKSTRAGVAGVYPIFVEANRRVRMEHPERFANTNQVQAVTWEGQRALWPNTAKKKWVMDAIARIRSAEGKGDIGHNEAREMVEALRVQLPGVSTGRAGAGTPDKVTGLPGWIIQGLK